MDRQSRTWLAATLAVAVLAGLLFVSSAPAQQGPQRPTREQCASVLPRETVAPVIERYRDRLRAAREAAMREERALRSLLIADNTTRAALDAQIARTNETRNAMARVRLDALWELRSVIPAQDREVALRCAARLLMRRR